MGGNEWERKRLNIPSRETKNVRQDGNVRLRKDFCVKKGKIFSVLERSRDFLKYITSTPHSDFRVGPSRWCLCGINLEDDDHVFEYK